MGVFQERLAAFGARLTERWGLGFRFHRRLSVIVTSAMLTMALGCLGLGIFTASLIIPTYFVHLQVAASGENAGDHPSVAYPVATTAPVAIKTPPGQRIAEVAVTVTPSPSATPIASATATPTPDPISTPVPCPPITAGQPSLTGKTVRDGTLPAPMIAGCPATLFISAPTLPDAPIAVSLYFGRSFAPPCVVYLTADQTDSAGMAQITFTVPANTCVLGRIMTTGVITVGDDSSANASLPANGN